MLCSKDEKLGFIYPLHNSEFNFDNDLIIKGIKIYNEICKVKKFINKQTAKNLVRNYRIKR